MVCFLCNSVIFTESKCLPNEKMAQLSKGLINLVQLYDWFHFEVPRNLNYSMNLSCNFNTDKNYLLYFYLFDCWNGQWLYFYIQYKNRYKQYTNTVSSSRAGFLERLCYLCPWKFSKCTWTKFWATWSEPVVTLF